MFYFRDLQENHSFHDSLLKDVVRMEDKEDEHGEVKKIPVIDFEKLKQINDETQGWIFYYDNFIQYPIVQTYDNSYYLTHAFDRSKNDNGTIFMDYRNSSWNDKNVILYGHNSVDNSMFGSLQDVFKDDFFDVEEHHFIRIITPMDTFVYQIFSYYIIEQEEYYITPNFPSEDIFSVFLEDMKKRSYRDFDLELSKDDFILTLSTCEGSGGTMKRKVIHAKRI